MTSGKRYFLLCLALLLLIAVLLYAHGRNTPPPAQENALQTERISSCYDGDTCTLSTKDRVRILGIDTPEISGEQCGAEAARSVTRAHAAGVDAQLAADPLQGDKDRYGRLLRYVQVPGTPDLGAYLVQHGYARVYEEYPVARTGEYLRLQQQAQQQELGIWSRKCLS